MIISFIVAVSQNNVIGKDGKLPWNLPADMQYFKRVTAHHHIIMGRGTYEALGKALPNRTNIIITRQKDYDAPGCVIVGDIKSAIDYAKAHEETECFIIGGGDIFRQSLVWADKIYLTRVFHNFEGDTFFPELNPDDWKLTSEERHLPDEKNHYAFAFQVFEIARQQETVNP
jgi:dihydrofolate reductase